MTFFRRTSICFWILLAPPLVRAFNFTTNYDIIQQFWSGAAHAPDKANALYLQKPLSGLTDAQCAPATGYPSQCPIELMSMTLNQAQGSGPRTGVYNFNLSFFGNTLISSPNSSGYFGMPDKCQYERNQTVLAFFNDTTKRVTFQILATTSDYTYCSYPSFSNAQRGTLPGQRCTGGSCYPQLVGQRFEGLFQLSKTADGGYSMDITIAFPYQIFGPGSWTDYAYTSGSTSFAPKIVTTAEVLTPGTVLNNNIIFYTLTAPSPWRPIQWFADRRPKIQRILPSFGPEEGGSTVTIIGSEFSTEPVFERQRSVLLSHAGGGGAMRECCSTATVSPTMMTCRLPRVSCISSNPVNPCPKPGQSFANQTAFIATRPSVKGFDPAADRAKLDDFVRYEGVWEVVDEDVYGGYYIPPSNVISGEVQILKTAAPAALASSSCCPVCLSPGSPACRLTIAQAVTSVGSVQPGIYTVTLPAIMRPGAPGVCDTATNGVNVSLTMGIERSTDPAGFTPATPLSITSCMDQVGPCRTVSRASIRVSCNQLIWSTGSIQSTLPPGQTVEVFTWSSDAVCDRRMVCVDGPCMWTVLANTSAPTEPKLQRRVSSAQLGLKVAWPTPFFTAPATISAFLADTAVRVFPAPADPYRVQLLRATAAPEIDVTLLGTTFAVRRAGRRAQSNGLCEPEPPYTACTMFVAVVYFLSGGPGTLGSELAAQAVMEEMAGSPFGATMLRELNVYRVCVDRSGSPANRAQNNLYQCYKVQYPGVLRMSSALTAGATDDGSTVYVRVKKQVWSYVSLAVTRTAGSDLGCTLDYRTVDYNGTGYAVGRGVDFASRVGQLRWLAGETATKRIVVPVRDNGLTGLDSTFEIWVYNAVNASMDGNDTQRAVVTIVGVNNWPHPLFIDTTLRTIGAICGAATAVPLALYLARIVRSLRRDISRARLDINKAGEDESVKRRGGLLGRFKSAAKPAGPPKAPKAAA